MTQSCCQKLTTAHTTHLLPVQHSGLWLAHFDNEWKSELLELNITPYHGREHVIVHALVSWHKGGDKVDNITPSSAKIVTNVNLMSTKKVIWDLNWYLYFDYCKKKCCKYNSTIRKLVNKTKQTKLQLIIRLQPNKKKILTRHFFLCPVNALLSGTFWMTFSK